jgi:predicted HTH domain antitoxin
LLSHQIGSNPEVAGYFEAHQKYRTWLDLIELAHKIDQAGGHAPPGRFLFDKILHPLELRDAVLRRKDLKAMVIVREPQATIRSIVRIGSGGHCSIDEAADYYELRLRQLREILDRRRGQALYLEPEALLEDSAATLAAITQYLGLSIPLTETYECFPMTGMAKFGDPSEWIGHGTIVRSRGKDESEAIEGARIAATIAAYEEFRGYAQAVAERAIVHGAPSSQPSRAMACQHGRRTARG